MGVLKTTVLVSGVIAISIASLLDYYNQTKNEKHLSPEDKEKLESVSCRPFDSWLSLLALAPIAIVIPMMVCLGTDYSQITGLLFASTYFVGNVVSKTGFMYRRTKTMALAGLPEMFVQTERRRMICNAWLGPAAWVIFFLVLILPLGP